MTDEELALKAKKGDANALQELALRHMSLIDMKARDHARSSVSMPSLQAEGLRLLALTTHRFVPTEGATFKTFLHTQLKSLNRFANQYRNIGRIPEHRAREIRSYKNMQDLLRMNKGREADSLEMSDAMGWSHKRVEMMERSLRRDLAASSFTDADWDLAARHTSALDETMELLYLELTPEQRLVWDYSLGKHGKPKIESVQEIAVKTGLSTDKVYAIKRKVAELARQAK